MLASPSATTPSSSASTAAHLAALRAKHETLEAKLQEEMARPHRDDFRIQSMKKQKLAIKQELSELGAD